MNYANFQDTFFPAGGQVIPGHAASEGRPLAFDLAQPIRVRLEPLGMRQVSEVSRAVGAPGEVQGARLVLSTPTPGGAFAAYASVIDNGTDDPRILSPR